MSSAEVQNTRDVAYSKPEELTNFITYAVAAALSFVGLVFLLIKTVNIGSSMAVASSLIFSVMPILAFTVGAIGHAVPNVKRGVGALIRSERSIVALLSFGVITPLLLIGLPRGEHSDAVWGYVLFALIAAAVIVAVAVNIADIKECKLICLFLYVFIGLACVVRITRIIALCGWDVFFYTFGGCAVYFVGTVVCAIRSLPARHTLWHLFVICGAALHFVGIYIYLY